MWLSCMAYVYNRYVGKGVAFMARSRYIHRISCWLHGPVYSSVHVVARTSLGTEEQTAELGLGKTE